MSEKLFAVQVNVTVPYTIFVKADDAENARLAALDEFNYDHVDDTGPGDFVLPENVPGSDDNPPVGCRLVGEVEVQATKNVTEVAASIAVAYVARGHGRRRQHYVRITIPTLGYDDFSHFEQRSAGRIDEIVSVLDAAVDGDVTDTPKALPHLLGLGVFSGTRGDGSVFINGVEFGRATVEQFIKDLKRAQLDVGGAGFIPAGH